MKKHLLFAGIFSISIGCIKKQPEPTPYVPEVPSHFPAMNIPADNPMTVEGVALGRKLFYEPLLSLNNSIACASCHQQSKAFSDPDQYSKGVGGTLGNRNSSALMNLAWQQTYFWDGRAVSLEEQILEPVPNPVEMHQSWPKTIQKLKEHNEYPKAFYEAFGTVDITKELVAKAIAQFLRTLISGQSKYDVMYKIENLLSLNNAEKALAQQITPEEWSGYDLFKSLSGGDCFHCHNGPLMQVHKYSNNGLDVIFSDQGRAAVTGNSADIGKFRVPSLRNIAFTAPYMHDGRFATLEEVIEHYSSGVKVSESIDPLMEFAHQGGVQLDANQKLLLKKFLLTLSDEVFITNPQFSKP